MKIYVDGELVKDTDIKGVICFMDEFKPNIGNVISVQFGNQELSLTINNKQLFSKDRERFLLRILIPILKEQEINNLITDFLVE